MDKFLLRNYDNLFRTFYNRRPMLENVNILRANIQCEFLLKLADQYDTLAVVRTYVEHHLLQFQSSLWESVAVLTHWYLHVSCMLRSKVIFKEALIHLVGIWYIFQEKPQSQFDIPESILDTAQRKVHELEENVSRVESQLFRLSLTTVQGEDVTPANDYLGWLVVSLFRQWLATSIKSQTGPARNSESESGDGRDSDDKNDIPPNLSICRVFRDIGSKSPSAYLDHHDCEEFLALNSQLYTRKNLADFERRMTELKFWARDLVRPLLRNNLELDVAKFNDSDIVRQDLTYFTCSTIEDSEFPWPLEPYIHYN
ncbi:hypothetical protein E4U57_002422 [Claviceps arundinis]|uniref:Uncharacterized protein n=1 Tax=Claviceps arundinis TaxID=1623583 RepID=A0ABQ7PQ42_9HYPO|nr:hypothetical protein E4U57_002422 [Claviceps arundinis]